MREIEEEIIRILTEEGAGFIHFTDITEWGRGCVVGTRNA